MDNFRRVLGCIFYNIYPKKSFYYVLAGWKCKEHRTMEADSNIEQEIKSLGLKKEVFLLWGEIISETPTTALQR